MKLSKYDNKCVKITCVDGKIYEGICQYNSHDYCYHEFGKDEEALEILHLLFYNSDIIKIRSIENHHGPYGKFSEPFGEVEIVTANDFDLLEQALDIDENEEHIYRILLCLENMKINDDIVKLLNNLVKYNYDDKIINKAKELIEKSKR